MKKLLSMIGIASIVCLVPACKKSDAEPGAAYSTTKETRKAKMLVSLSSKECPDPQTEYTSLTLDIKKIKIYNALHGWEELKPESGTWDLVNMQQSGGVAITKNSAINAGLITKVAITFGDSSALMVKGSFAKCFNLSTKEIVLDLDGKVKAGFSHELKLTVDICGNISVKPVYDEDPCYTLKPVINVDEFIRLDLE